MVWHWLVSWCSFKTFRLAPSSVGKITLARVIQNQHVERALSKIPREVSRKRSARFMRVPETCKLLGWRCGHFQTLLGSLVFYKGSTIWKWPHRHPRSLQVSGTHISLALRFQKTSRRIFLSAPSKCWFWITCANVIFPTDEGLSTSRNVLKEHQKTSQCQTIILQGTRILRSPLKKSGSCEWKPADRTSASSSRLWVLERSSEVSMNELSMYKLRSTDL